MLVGAVVLAIALTDHLLQLIFKGQHGIVQEKAGEGTDYGKPVNYHSVFICSLYSARNGCLGRSRAHGCCLGGYGIIHI